MALNDFVSRLKPAAGQASPRDEVTGTAVLGTNDQTDQVYVLRLRNT